MMRSLAIPKPTPKKRGVLFLSPEDMQEANKSMKEKSLNATMKYDPAFATSPICISDKDYDFSVDPELITSVNLIHFMAMNLKLLWHTL